MGLGRQFVKESQWVRNDPFRPLTLVRKSLSRFLDASGCDFWPVGSVDSNPFPECHLSAPYAVVRSEISQVAEFASQITSGWRLDCFRGDLAMSMQVRRLRLRCGNALRRRICLAF